jgi:hypothetical protein
MPASRFTVEDKGINVRQVFFFNSPKKMIDPVSAGLVAKHLMDNCHDRSTVAFSVPVVEPE